MLKQITRLLTFITLFATLCIGATLYILYQYGRSLPEYEHLRHYEPPMTSRLYTADAQLLQEYGKERRLFVPYHAIPERLKQAFLAAEDKNFFYHFGIDILGTVRALLINTLRNSWDRHPGGASSITQQVAKNFLTGNERSFARKVKEAIMAFRLESSIPKERIFELYLNQIYLGAGTYGVAAAALTYFDKELEDLTLDEIAFLAALPKAPSTLTANADLSRILARRNWVIDRMFDEKYITLDAALEAKERLLQFRKHREFPLKADYFTDAVRREVLEKLGPKQLQEGGLYVRTTLDHSLQTIADQSLRQGLINYDQRQGWRGPVAVIGDPEELEEALDLETAIDEEEPWLELLRQVNIPLIFDNWQFGVVLSAAAPHYEIGLRDGRSVPLKINKEWPKESIYKTMHPGDVIIVSATSDGGYELQQIPEATGAVVIISPKTGRILALSGGFDFNLNQYNCATMAKRQPGSVFKTFVYLAALEKGMSPETKIMDAPMRIYVGGKLGYYSPKNYTNEYFGLSELRVGLEKSHNAMTIRLAQKIGIACIVDTARKFGIHSSLPRQFAMALGAAETSVVKMTAAYAMIANGGTKITPYLIESIQDRYGNGLLNPPELEQEQLASPQTITDITDMLTGVITNGTARKLQSLGLSIAGKTGTTNDCKDAWFIGFTKDIVVGVFVGHPSSKSLGLGETGGKIAVPIFGDILQKIYKTRQKPAELRSSKYLRKTYDIEMVEENLDGENDISALQGREDQVSIEQINELGP